MQFEGALQPWTIGATRIRWGAIIAGLAVGVAIQMVLALLGLAIGAWSIDVRDSGSTGIPIGSVIWTVASMLISAFIGGYLAARLSGAYQRSDGVYHGAVVWGVTWLLFAWLATTAVSYLIGGVFNIFGSTLTAVSQGVGAAATKVAEKTDVNINAGDLRRQIESTLAATGKAELQPSEIRKDANRMAEDAQKGASPGQVSETALAEVKEKLAALDRDAAVNVLVTKMGMSEPQARELVETTLSALGPLADKARNVKEKSLDVANTGLNRLGSAAWWLFVLAILSLGVSVAGGATGVSQAISLEAADETYRVKRAS